MPRLPFSPPHPPVARDARGILGGLCPRADAAPGDGAGSWGRPGGPRRARDGTARGETISSEDQFIALTTLSK